MASLDKLRKGLHGLIDTVDDESVLAICKQILEREQKREQDFWDHLSDEEKAGVERGLADVEASRVHAHNEVMNSIKEKYNL
jgi:predicted transcriptional regulator